MEINLQRRQGNLQRLRKVWRETRAERRTVDDKRLKGLTFSVDRRLSNTDGLTIHLNSLPTFLFFYVFDVFVWKDEW
jgi:hypothetical protein